jgi:hypothetical protein
VETELLKVEDRAVESEPRGRGEVADAEADAEDRGEVGRVRAETAEAAATEANNKIKAVLTMLGETSDESRLLVDEVLQLKARDAFRIPTNDDVPQGTSHRLRSCIKSQSLLPTKSAPTKGLPWKSKPASNKKYRYVP